MSRPSSRPPRCIIIAGPNGAGKTTFAREFLPRDAGIIHFVNADLIAGGLSPLRPELAVLSGGRLFLAELDRLARARADFAFETTLSGLGYLHRIERWKAAGYRLEITYLRLPSPQLALRRIAARLPTPGRCMTIPATHRACWNKAHENETESKTPLALRRRRGPRPAPLRPRGAQDRPPARHPHLPLARRQGRG
jgi:predicted ABC-type ATPase